MSGFFESNFLKHRLNEQGQGIVEYALVLAVVVVIAAAIHTGGLEEKITGSFNNTADMYDQVQE